MNEESNLQEQQLQNALLTNYLANLEFLNEYDNELYHKVEVLSQMIGNTSYKEKYRLEFIKEDGDFDVYDLKNQTYLYNKCPKRINRKLVNTVDFNEKNTIKSLEKALYSSSKNRLDEITLRKIKNSLQEANQSILLVKNEVLEYVNIFDEKENKKLKKIDKFIFFGTLLGRHIFKIAEKLNTSLYFVCEKNLELFRLSLFVNNYRNLAKKCGVIFSIMDEEDSVKKIDMFLNINPFSNYMLKFSSTGINVKEYIDYFLTSLVVQKPTSFDYNRFLYVLMRNASEKINNYKFIDFKENINYNFFDRTPVLFIAAGPSFQSNLKWVKENQNKFFVVTIGAAYKTLLKNNIKVDLLISLDSSYEILSEKQFSLEDVKLLKDTIVLCSSMTSKKLLDIFDQDRLFIYEVIYSFFNSKECLSAFSVGEKSIDLLLNMGVKNLYLIGLDLALDQETGESHHSLSDSSRNNHDLENIDLDDRSTFGLNEGIIKVKGNLNNEVLTTSLFKASLICMNEILSKIKEEDVLIYNLSNNGAYFENTIPLEIENLEVKEFNNVPLTKDKFLDFINNNSKKYLPKENIKKVEEEISYINDVVLNELSICKDEKFNNYDEFYNRIINLINMVAFSKEKTSFLNYIYKSYCKIIFNYLELMFNDKKIKKEQIKVEKVKEVFFKQFEYILTDYTKYLEEIKKPKL